MPVIKLSKNNLVIDSDTQKESITLVNRDAFRFEKTYHALKKCLEVLRDKDEIETLSESEEQYYQDLIGLCEEFLESAGVDDDE